MWTQETIVFWRELRIGKFEPKKDINNPVTKIPQINRYSNNILHNENNYAKPQSHNTTRESMPS